MLQCMRRQLAWCKHNSDIIDNEQQYSLYPRALADEEGHGSKSRWTDKLQNHYRTTEPTIFTINPPWIPQIVLLGAMFLINFKPLRHNKTIQDYFSTRS